MISLGGHGHTMLSGFNTNFRYRGVLFHVQTEDSGLENPHVITHLFHGGNIMSSEKRDYSDLIEELPASELDGSIRKLMEGLHKSMLKQLSRGEHDVSIEQRMGPDVFRVAATDKMLDPPTVTEGEAPRPQTRPTASPTSTSDRAAGGRMEPPTETTGSPLVADPEALAATAADSVPRVAEPAMLETDELGTSPTKETQPVSRFSKVFGDRVVSEKPLDEVVLDYLVENARKRKRSNR